VNIGSYFNRIVLVAWLAFIFGTTLNKVGATVSVTYDWQDPFWILLACITNAALGMWGYQEWRDALLLKQIADERREKATEDSQ
jgi:hypothetical protein